MIVNPAQDWTLQHSIVGESSSISGPNGVYFLAENTLRPSPFTYSSLTLKTQFSQPERSKVEEAVKEAVTKEFKMYEDAKAALEKTEKEAQERREKEKEVK
jgi:hypothetical protein